MSIILLTRVIIISFCGVIISTIRYATGNTLAPQCSRTFSGQDNAGIITSYNYPFEYRNNLNCKYIIQLDHIDPTAIKEVCFIFHRFNTESCEEKEPNDYLRFQDNNSTYTYCGDGTLYAKGDAVPSKHTIWTKNLCFNATGKDQFVVDFVSDGSIVGRGFYARFEINTTATDHGVNDTKAPCSENEWTCFSRNCIPDNKTCDSHSDCDDNTDEMYGHSGCTTGQYKPSLLACDFHLDCGFQGIGNGWIIQNTRTAEDRGPADDHTVGGNTGKYARTDFSSLNEVFLFDTTLPDVRPGVDQCVSFWYHMFGPDPGKLNVVYGETTRLILWTREGNFGDTWHHGEVALPGDILQTPREVLFKASSGSDRKSQIALDDISVMPGNCVGDDVACDFSISMCGFETEIVSTEPEAPHWKRVKGQSSPLGPPSDASGSEIGYYMVYYKESPTSAAGEDYIVTPPVIVADKDTVQVCLTFAYFLQGESETAYLLTSIELNNGNITPQPTNLLRTGANWTWMSHNFIHVQEPFKIKLRPVFNDYPMVFALDETAVTQGLCNNIAPGSCGPEEFRCSNNQCVLASQTCDGVSDCDNGSDESQEACRLRCQDECAKDEFCCANGGCIDEDEYCNGINNCGDWSDEDGCSKIEDCGSEMIWCIQTKRCIDKIYFCNDNDDCGNNQDEELCDNNFPPLAVMGIVIGILFLVVIGLSAIGNLIYKHKDKIPCLRSNNENDNDNSSEDDDQSVSSQTRYPTILHVAPEPPPGYYQTLNHPDRYTRPNSTASLTGHRSAGTSHSSREAINTVSAVVEHHQPPSYDRVESGEYIETINTTAHEIERVKQEMLRRSKTTLDIATSPPPYHDISPPGRSQSAGDLTRSTLNSSAYTNEGYVSQSSVYGDNSMYSVDTSRHGDISRNINDRTMDTTAYNAYNNMTFRSDQSMNTSNMSFEHSDTTLDNTVDTEIHVELTDNEAVSPQNIQNESRHPPSAHGQTAAEHRQTASLHRHSATAHSESTPGGPIAQSSRSPTPVNMPPAADRRPDSPVPQRPVAMAYTGIETVV